MDKEKSAHFKHYMKSAKDFIPKVYHSLSKCLEKRKWERKTVGPNAGLAMIFFKYILLFFNLFYIMISWLMIILGIYVPSIFWTVNGAILICIAIFGIHAALKQSSTLAYIYGFVMMISFILQIVAAISTFSLFFNAELQARIVLSKLMEGYSNDNIRMYTMDWIQKSFQCCGNDGPIDWSYYSHYGTINTYYWDWYIEKLTTTTGPDIRLKTPSSCCLSGSDYRNLTCDKYFQNGCAIQIRDILSESTMIIGSSALALALVQLLAMVIAFMLARLIRRTTYTHVPKRDEQSSAMIFDTSTYIDYLPIANDEHEHILWLDHKEIIEIMSVK